MKLLGTGRVAIEFSFPIYGTGQNDGRGTGRSRGAPHRFTQPGRDEAGCAHARRGHLPCVGAMVACRDDVAAGPHAFLLSAASGEDTLAFTSTFSAAAPAGPLPTFENTNARNAGALEPVLVHWGRDRSSWQHGPSMARARKAQSCCRST